MRYARLSILVVLGSVCFGCAGQVKNLQTADSAVQAEPRRVSDGKLVWSHAPHGTMTSGSPHPTLF